MPKEYIERDELLKRFERYSCGFIVEDDYDTALTIIHGAPIDDELVEVVRCEKCHNSCYFGNVLYCTFWDRNTDEDAFCSYGERKDGADNG